MFSSRPAGMGRSFWGGRGWVRLSWAAAFAVGGLTLWIAGTIAYLALPAVTVFDWGFLGHSAWNPVREDYGVLAALYGTVACAVIAMGVAAPIGGGAAIVFSERLLAFPFYAIATLREGILAAIPSVVYGFWGLVVLVPR